MTFVAPINLSNDIDSFMAYQTPFERGRHALTMGKCVLRRVEVRDAPIAASHSPSGHPTYCTSKAAFDAPSHAVSLNTSASTQHHPTIQILSAPSLRPLQSVAVHTIVAEILPTPGELSDSPP